MLRIAIFVDAGYLFAQGSAAIWGEKQARSALDLNADAVFKELIKIAKAKAPDASILRVYWYDGASGRPSLEQSRLGHMDNFKVRLGFINSHGQQKGVDSLIVTDLVELARNRAMSDALLLAGDEDVRIGVQIAQSFGVRIHLLGIVPSRGSQSQQLIQEADTSTEWDSKIVSQIITKRESAIKTTNGISKLADGTAIAAPSSSLVSVVAALVAELRPSDITNIKTYWQNRQTGVPSEFDGKLLARGRDLLQRDLVIEEKRQLRALFSKEIKAKP